MFRFLFVMILTALVGVGSGYFLWGSRVARLTEALSTLTLELDTMRERLAAPRNDAATEGAARTTDELRVINETVAAIRQELVDQKAMMEKHAAEAAAGPPDAAAATAEARGVRVELARCIADKQDLEVRCAGAAAPSAAPAPAPPPPPTYFPR